MHKNARLVVGAFMNSTVILKKAPKKTPNASETCFYGQCCDPKKRPKKMPNASETLGKRTPNLSVSLFFFFFFVNETYNWIVLVTRGGFGWLI